MKYPKFLISVILIAVLLIACRNTSQPEEKKIAKTPLEVFSKQLNEMNPEIVSGNDVSKFFELSGAAYNSNLVLDPLIWEKYKDDPIRAAAVLGIYTTDAIYQYSYEISDGAYLSWMAAKSLAKGIGLAGIYDEIIIKRVEEGLTPDDSVVFKLNKAMLKTGSEISEAERLRIFTALRAGGYIEKLHIVMGSIWDGYEGMPDDIHSLMVQEMLLYLLRQLEELQNLLALIEEHERLDDKGVLAYELKKMRDTYISLDESIDDVPGLLADQILTNPKAIALRESVTDIRRYLTDGVEP